MPSAGFPITPHGINLSNRRSIGRLELRSVRVLSDRGLPLSVAITIDRIEIFEILVQKVITQRPTYGIANNDDV